MTEYFFLKWLLALSPISTVLVLMIFFDWGGKGIIDIKVTFFGSVIFQHRETRDPGEVKLVIICEIETVAEVAPQNVQSRVNYTRLTRHEKNKIACLKVGGFSK